MDYDSAVIKNQADLGKHRQHMTTDDWLRAQVVGIVKPIVRDLARLQLHPNTITIVGFILNVAAGFIVMTGRLGVGGIVMLVASATDALDGALARETSQQSRFGAFLDSTLDRLSEGAVLLGLLAWFLRQRIDLGVLMATFALLGVGDGELHAGASRRRGLRVQGGAPDTARARGGAGRRPALAVAGASAHWTDRPHLVHGGAAYGSRLPRVKAESVGFLLPPNTALRRVLGVVTGPVVLGLLLLPALLPLLQAGLLPCTHDNMFHAYRIVAMRSMLDHGWVFSRWVPNLALGYGYPFFNYREPLPYWVGEAGYLAGLPLSLVLGLIYAASLVGAAWGAYVLARDLFGEHAGWIAGVAYGLGPYVLLDPLRRGNLPESVALALLPWLFVAIRRVVLGRRRGTAFATLVLLVALFLTHNISSLLAAPFLGLYVVLLAFLYRDRKGWMTAFLVVGAAILLTAWFWLPALAERGMVQLDLSRATRNNDFHYNFVTWQEMLLTPPVAHDPDYLNPPMRVSVGIGQLVLGVIGAVVGLRGGVSRQQRSITLLMVAAAGAYLWMATPGSVAVWERVGLLSFVQFPWRLVGRALLPLSLLAGQAASLWSDGPTGRARDRENRVPTWVAILATSSVMIALTLLSWPDTYPPKGMCSAGRYPTLADLYAREEDGWMGMDPESSYFPIWVETHPSDTGLASDFADGYLPERMDMDSLPAGAKVVRSEYRPLASAVAIDTPVGFRARWLGLYFPGWRAQIDGVDVPVAPENDTGLITFAVPAGEHLVMVYFGSTPIRDLGAALSLVGVALTLGWALWGPGRRRRRPVQGAPPAQGPQQTATGPHRRGGSGALLRGASGDRRGAGRRPSHCGGHRSFPRAAVAVGEWRAARGLAGDGCVVLGWT